MMKGTAHADAAAAADAAPLMLATIPAPMKVLDFEPAASDVAGEVLAGLSAPRKTLPCKLFYDEAGSRLFDRICDLPEYYPTRTELRIMRDCAGEMAEAIGPRALVVEYGSGTSLKTRVLLDHLSEPVGYVPIDISRGHLVRAARELAARYPSVAVRPVCADYTRPFWLPTFAEESPARTVAYFPGSTIGNFEPDDARTFLKSIRATCGKRSGLLIGVDLKKDPSILHAAYNDAAGVTAQFNLNLLRRINRDIGSDFDPSAFAHYAPYNPTLGRMEMNLVSRRQQEVKLSRDVVVRLADGEPIHTESCYKHTVDSFSQLAAQAGYTCRATWTDRNAWFSVSYFEGDAKLADLSAI